MRAAPADRLFVRAALVAAALGAPLGAQDEGRAVAAFARLFAPPPKGAFAQVPKQRNVDRREALGALATFDSARVAAALAAAFAVVDAEIEGTQQRHLEATTERETLLQGQLDQEQQNLPADREQQLAAVEALLGSLRRSSDDLRHLRGQLGGRLQGLRQPGALQFLLAHLSDRAWPLSLRLEVAGGLAHSGDATLASLAAALRRAREPEDCLPLIDALGRAGAAVRPHAGALIATLQHGNEAVRERAAIALARVAVAEAVAPMIAMLERHTGQSRARIAAALEQLTGQRHGNSIAAWQAWWAAEGEAFVQSPPPLGQGTVSDAACPTDSYYHGIPQEHSSGILYCIDCSGSMKDPVDSHATVAPGDATALQRLSRLEACKRELVRALGRLDPRQQFAILWYNDGPHWWEPRLQAAAPDVVAAAQAFVRTLQAARTTNIHDSLERAFTLVGRGARDRYYGPGLDTIFLLTDGSPTRSDGTFDSTERIVAAVRQWNPLHRVTIHTIGIGDGLDEPFLQALADDNGGQFRRL